MSTTNTLDLNNRIDALEKNSGGGSADSAKRSDIATEFSATTAYTAGCFVYYEGKLYQFNADHAAGAWDPTDVVEANVTDQVVSNASTIAGLTASDVAYVNTTSGLTATDVQGAVDEVKDSIPDSILLWTNPNPSDDFAAQTIPLDLTGYRFVEVYGLNGANLNYSKTVVGAGGCLMYFTGSSSATYGTVSDIRTYTTSSTGIDFSNNFQAYTGSASTVDNSLNKPKYIYGIK